MKDKKIVDITLVIPTCNRSSDILSSLESYFSGISLPSEIIVVDQSNDCEHEIISNGINKLNEKFNIINLIRINEKSSTKARNVGLIKAKNDIVVFSDDDVNIYKDTIGETFKIMSRDDYGMCGGLDKHNKYHSNFLSSFLSCLVGRKTLNQIHSGCVTKSIYGSYPYKTINKETNTKWAMGYYFSIKKTFAFKRNLYFDEKMSEYAYGEDLDYTYRYWRECKKEGLKCVLTPEIAVYHLVSNSNRLATQEMYLKNCINRLYLSHKLFPKKISARFAYKWANFCTGLRLIFKKSEHSMWMKACKKAKQNKDKLKNGIIENSMYKF